MFSLSGLLAASKTKRSQKLVRLKVGRKNRKKTPTPLVTGCIGTAVRFWEKYQDSQQSQNAYGYACSLRCCKHPIHTKDRCRSFSRGRSDDLIPEDIYKRYTETDSRPLSPEFTRRSVSAPRRINSSGNGGRRCVTPEPETRQCQFYTKRVLILDLRRVKSVDAIARQGSRTPGTSVDSTYGDDDGDYHSSSANPDSSSVFHQLSPRNMSMSRSITPKTKKKRGGKSGGNRAKERSSSPIVYERSSSPKILEGLTLPPLHSSVLTLLGQRGGLKPSPRNLLGQIHEHSVSSGAGRQKKLRRHGRKKKGNEKSDGDNEPTETVRSASMKPMTQDEINETQISSFIPEGNLESEEESGRNRISEDKLQASMHNLMESRRALYYVLEDYVGGKPWSFKEMGELENEISSLSNYFDKFQTKFKTEDIRMKQDTWLSFPRTWSRASASFGVPYDIKSLKEMTPIQYLLTCVTITEPRKHLYDMVFQRYRMKENPTGTHISVKMLMAALTEVIGRQLSTKEMDELCFTYLGIQDLHMQIDKQLFAVISAFCERIYAVYSSEDLNECYTCDRTDVKKDKLRCHQNQKSLLERTDLAFLSAKIRDGQVQSQLSKLLHALCERD